MFNSIINFHILFSALFDFEIITSYKIKPAESPLIFKRIMKVNIEKKPIFLLQHKSATQQCVIDIPSPGSKKKPDCTFSMSAFSNYQNYPCLHRITAPVINIFIKARGIKDFQPRFINWS